MANTVMRLLVFASLAITAACADGGPLTPIGRYMLMFVGPSSVPAVMYQEEGYKLEVKSGTLELSDSGRYAMTTTVDETVDGNKSTYTDTESGTWALGGGGSIVITLVTGEQLTAAWDKGQLTVTRDEVALRYAIDR